MKEKSKKRKQRRNTEKKFKKIKNKRIVTKHTIKHQFAIATKSIKVSRSLM